MGLRAERWRIRPTETPRPWRYCSTCGEARAFVCSGRFRVNAQKKSIDVWLNYRCSSCEAVWKYPLFERRAVAELDRALHEAFARHDEATVWRYAFDVGRLRPHVIRVDTDVNVVIERLPVDAESQERRIDLEVPFPCDLRLDRLLANELRLSRTLLQRWYEEGKLRVSPEQRDALRKRIRDRQTVWLPEMPPPCPPPATGGGEEIEAR